MTHTRRALMRHNNLATWLMLAFAAYVTLPQIVMPWLFIDLRSVEVEVIDGEPVVTADRIIRQDFQGTYQVTVRTAAHERICVAEPAKKWSPYESEASGINPLVKPLWWWLGSKADYERCVGRGMTNGVFYINTCHSALWKGIEFGPRCVTSNTFRLK
ncbi:hypothetical protein [Thiosulfatihalobacter marinus]|uniref:hypothetical protein n=1 Tax=Thiosulfatihalobacter marinus TaxID=2792481 RepID=UPI0018D8E1CB|nr:hypothetical protein [Thiosulfatihalobacter marinus]